MADYTGAGPPHPSIPFGTQDVEPFGTQDVEVQRRESSSSILGLEFGQVVAKGVGGGDGSGGFAFGANFGVDVGDMAFGGTHADYQFPGNLLVAFAGGNPA